MVPSLHLPGRSWASFPWQKDSRSPPVPGWPAGAVSALWTTRPRRGSAVDAGRAFCPCRNPAAPAAPWSTTPNTPAPAPWTGPGEMPSGTTTAGGLAWEPCWCLASRQGNWGGRRLCCAAPRGRICRNMSARWTSSPAPRPFSCGGCCGDSTCRRRRPASWAVVWGAPTSPSCARAGSQGTRGNAVKPSAGDCQERPSPLPGGAAWGAGPSSWWMMSGPPARPCSAAPRPCGRLLTLFRAL